MTARVFLAVMSAAVFVVWSSLCTAPRIAGVVAYSETQRGSAPAGERMPGPSAQPSGVLTPVPCCVVAASRSSGVTTTEGHRGWVTDEAFMAALASTPWPVERWPPVLALASCESPMNRDNERIGIALDTVGQMGEQGPLQVLPSAHADLARSFDLFDLHEALVAGYVLYLQAGSSLTPWSCSESK